MPRRIAAVLAAVLLVLACRSPEERLVDRKNDLRRALDGLYAEYGHAEADGAGDGGEGAPGGADARGTGPAGVVGRFVAELDRGHFEETCLSVGRGERPFILSDRLAGFVADPGHAEGCRRAAHIAADVAALERELPRRERGAP